MSAYKRNARTTLPPVFAARPVHVGSVLGIRVAGQSLETLDVPQKLRNCL